MSRSILSCLRVKRVSRAATSWKRSKKVPSVFSLLIRVFEHKSLVFVILPHVLPVVKKKLGLRFRVAPEEPFPPLAEKLPVEFPHLLDVRNRQLLMKSSLQGADASVGLLEPVKT